MTAHHPSQEDRSPQPDLLPEEDGFAGTASQKQSRKPMKGRGRALYKTLDAVATTPLREDGHWRSALSLRLSNYERAAALVQACDRLIPGVAQRLSQRLLGSQALPLPGGHGALYAFGSGSTVFLLDSSNKVFLGTDKQILKVYRRTLGLNAQQLLQYAHFLRAKYVTVRRWYGAGSNHVYILPSFYFVLNAPLLGAPAVGAVQPFVAQKMRDLFLDFSDDALLTMMAQDPSFGRQMQFFCEQTSQMAAREGRCVDFVGRDNVSVLEKESGGWQLAILDFGIFDLQEKRAKAPAAFAQVAERLTRIATWQRAMGESRGEIERMSATVSEYHESGQR